MQLSSRVSGPLVLGLLGGTAALLSVVAYSRAVLGDPMRATRDSEGVLRFVTREEVLQDRLEASERLEQASPQDASRARVTAMWRKAVREARLAEESRAPAKAATADELNL
jgi:hypothetical protein